MTLPDLHDIADALLLEPGRTPDVLAPLSSGDEAWWMEAQLLVEGLAPRIAGELRFVQTCRREVLRADGSRGPIQAAGRLHEPRDTSELREIPFAAEQEKRFRLAAARLEEPIHEGTRLVGKAVSLRPLQHGRVAVRLERRGPRLWRVAVRVENLEGAGMNAPHLLLRVAGGRFLSLLDPPAHARAEAEACVSRRLFPVLARPDGELVLAAAIPLHEPLQAGPARPAWRLDADERSVDRIEALGPGTLQP
jgi:hypothetical protein